MSVPVIPALRAGRPYMSTDTVALRDIRTGLEVAGVAVVNPALIRRDLARLAPAARALREISVGEIIQRLAAAGDHFATDTLPLGDGWQSPDDYVASLSVTNGLPYGLVRKNMIKLAGSCQQAAETLAGMMRGLDRAILDRGWIPTNGSVIAFAPVAEALCVLLPSNSPGVNTLWLPAIALKIPVVLKPGREEPWTPYRLIQACLRAGLPPEAFSFYPTDHAGAEEVLGAGGWIMLFGDEQTVARYAGDARTQAHGPGWSKIVIGEDCIDRWPEFLDVCVSSILENGGRSCINASAIVVPRWGDAIADALARRLAAVGPTPLGDEHGQLAAFATPHVAERITETIEAGLRAGGAIDVTAVHRAGGRLVTCDAATFLLPTVIRCDSFEHPLAGREFPFPYATAIEVPQAEIPRQIGRSLVVTAITGDDSLVRDLYRAPGVDHLHIGPIPTWQIRRDQPHEGNLFDFLYRQRAFQWAGIETHAAS